MTAAWLAEQCGAADSARSSYRPADRPPPAVPDRLGTALVPTLPLVSTPEIPLRPSPSSPAVPRDGSTSTSASTSAAADGTKAPSAPALRAVCVYCASSTGNDPALADTATALGRLLAERGTELVFGGGAVGLMGRIADTVLEAGGTVTGIIPTTLMPREVAHRGLTRLIEVDSMHARKARMIELSDGFIALPGGFGTLEELAEVLTWAQLGLHTKPIGLVNTGGFYDGLLRFFDRAVADGVLKPSNRTLLLTNDDPAALLASMESHHPDREPKWADLDLDRRL